MESGRFAGLSTVVRVGAAVASFGVLLSLIVGVSRTAFAMAANGELPSALAAVHPRYKVPHRAELAVGAIVAVFAATVDLRSAIGFSSFAVLTYYALANASAWTLAPGERRWPRVVSAVGFAGCAVLALALPIQSVLGDGAVLVVGMLAYRFLAPRGGA